MRFLATGRRDIEPEEVLTVSISAGVSERVLGYVNQPLATIRQDPLVPDWVAAHRDSSRQTVAASAEPAGRRKPAAAAKAETPSSGASTGPAVKKKPAARATAVSPSAESPGSARPKTPAADQPAAAKPTARRRNPAA
ncbi:MAG TPA: hypothetical protein VGM80_09445 [Gaiellaceae bacterium]